MLRFWGDTPPVWGYPAPFTSSSGPSLTLSMGNVRLSPFSSHVIPEGPIAGEWSAHAQPIRAFPGAFILRLGEGQPHSMPRGLQQRKAGRCLVQKQNQSWRRSLKVMINCPQIHLGLMVVLPLPFQEREPINPLVCLNSV